MNIEEMLTGIIGALSAQQKKEFMLKLLEDMNPCKIAEEHMQIVTQWVSEYEEENSLDQLFAITFSGILMRYSKHVAQLESENIEINKAVSTQIIITVLRKLAKTFEDALSAHEKIEA